MLCYFLIIFVSSWLVVDSYSISIRVSLIIVVVVSSLVTRISVSSTSMVTFSLSIELSLSLLLYIILNLVSEVVSIVYAPYSLILLVEVSSYFTTSRACVVTIFLVVLALGSISIIFFSTHSSWLANFSIFGLSSCMKGVILHFTLKFLRIPWGS